MSTATFRFSTDILRRLGEELITSFDQGIVELVKNSYDADAIECVVELVNTETLGGTVKITDDGDGMTIEDIRDGWLLLGRSRKDPRKRTRLNRLPAGSKGLGRLGAIRLGHEVVLATRPRSQPGVEHTVRISWSDFDRRQVVEDVELPIESARSDQRPGTRVEIRLLRRTVSIREVRRLAREFLLLADPFGDPSGFRPRLVAQEFKSLEHLVGRGYFDDCEWRLLAALDHEGRASAKVFDRSGRVRWVAENDDFDRIYSAPEATFELWAFLLQGDSFVGRTATVGEVRQWLRQVGGVHLYHRGLRVRPYGDVGHDWLDMNLSRARDPELRPSTNTSVGRVTVLDEAEELLQKTDRTGFVENEAFRELRRFAVNSLEWMHVQRLAERERRRNEEKKAARKRNEKAAEDLRRAIRRLPSTDAAVINKAIREVSLANRAARLQMEDEISLYRTLASVGTSVSVFAHEIDGPATNVVLSSSAIERRGRRSLAGRYEKEIGRQVEAVKRAATLLSKFAKLPLGMLKRSKRRRAMLSLNDTVRDTLVLFEPYLTDAHVEFSCELCDEDVHVLASISSVESILSNLITNSVKAFKRQDGRPGRRKLIVRTQVVGDTVLIVVLDNGPGIPNRIASRIWLPGITSDENGTGLGLTIVRDTVIQLGGRVESSPSGELGGAEFTIELPRAAVTI